MTAAARDDGTSTTGRQYQQPHEGAPDAADIVPEPPGLGWQDDMDLEPLPAVAVPRPSTPAALARPFKPHVVALPAWQPPPSTLQHRTALTRAILACRSYSQLHPLLVDNGGEFNVYHTCACFSRVVELQAAGLGPREARLFFKDGCTVLTGAVRRQLAASELHPRACVTVAYGLARLELPDRDVLVGLSAAVEPHLTSLAPQGLSSLVWALAKLGYQPPPRWMDGFLAACVTALKAFRPADTSLVLCALAKLGFKAAPERLQALLAHARANLSFYNGHSLCSVVYGLALAQQHPGPEWLEAVQARAVQLTPAGFTPQGMTKLAWAVARLGAEPTPPFLALLSAHLAPHIAGQHPKPLASAARGKAASAAAGVPLPYRGIDYATLLYALGVWEHGLPRKASGRVLAALHGELPSLEPNQLCNVAWACARLRLYPIQSWFKVWFDRTFQLLPNFKPGDLSQVRAGPGGGGGGKGGTSRAPRAGEVGPGAREGPSIEPISRKESRGRRSRCLMEAQQGGSVSHIAIEKEHDTADVESMACACVRAGDHACVRAHGRV